MGLGKVAPAPLIKSESAAQTTATRAKPATSKPVKRFMKCSPEQSGTLKLPSSVAYRHYGIVTRRGEFVKNPKQRRSGAKAREEKKLKEICTEDRQKGAAGEGCPL